MASFLNTTQTLLHKTPLPSDATREAAIAMLHDHDLMIECSPHVIKVEKKDPSESPDPELPEDVAPLDDTKCYQVTDRVHALPAGLWDSDVVSTYEFTNVSDGVFVRIRSPMSIVLDTRWSVAQAEAETDTDTTSQEGDLSEGSKTPNGSIIREEVTIKCSRLLSGIVKGQCEGNWQTIHGKMLARLKV